MGKRKAEAGKDDYDKMRAEAERLRKELRLQKMRAEALDTMIDVAEEMFNIPIMLTARIKSFRHDIPTPTRSRRCA